MSAWPTLEEVMAELEKIGLGDLSLAYTPGTGAAVAASEIAKGVSEAFDGIREITAGLGVPEEVVRKATVVVDFSEGTQGLGDLRGLEGPVVSGTVH